MNLLYKCSIPKHRVEKGIIRLEIGQADGGYYLFQYDDDTCKPPLWDSYYEEIEDIFEGCLEEWGIEKCDWIKGN